MKRIRKWALDGLALLMLVAAAAETVILAYNNPDQLLLMVAFAVIVVLPLRWAVARLLRKRETDDEIKPVNSRARTIRTIGGVCLLLAVAVITTPKHPAEAQGYYYNTYNATPDYAAQNNTSFNNQNVGGMEAFGYQTMGQYLWSVMKDPFTWAAGAGGFSRMLDRSEDPGHSIWRSGSGKMPGAQP